MAKPRERLKTSDDIKPIQINATEIELSAEIDSVIQWQPRS
jgi:hypothetical protein